MVNNTPLSKSLPLASIILPYFGFVDECCILMQSLCVKSQKLWRENEQILLRIISKKRTITLHVCNDHVMELINLKSLKYFNIDVENAANFMTLLRNRLLTLKSQAHEELFVGKPSPCIPIMESRTSPMIDHKSTCPNFIHCGDISLNIDNLEEISSHISLYENLNADQEVVCEGISHDVDSWLKEIPYMDTLTLMNNTDLAQFFSHEKRARMVEFAYDIEKTTDELKIPFIKQIGTLKVNVECTKFLKQFLTICDTQVDTIEFCNFLKIEGDMFSKQDDLSQTLKKSVRKIITNKSFESTLHRFSNVEDVQVQNFPAVNYLLNSRIQSLKNIEFLAESFSSIIIIKNSFIVGNNTECEPLYCEEFIAHFSAEDVTISDDLRYLYIGGNMISINGTSLSKIPENLKQLINQGKDTSKEEDRIIVLLDNDANFPIISIARKQFAYPRQIISVKTSSKLIDIKIKKVDIQIEINSNSDLLLRKQPSNEVFLQSLKLLINGKGKITTQKLNFAIKNQAIKSIVFDVQKYSDASKLLDQLSPLLPSVIQTLGITVAQSNGGLIGDKDEDKLSVTQKLKTSMNKFPKIETILKDLNFENSIRLYYSQIMNNCFQVERSS